MRKIEDLKVALISPRAVAAKNMIRRVQPPLGLCCIAANLRDKGIKNILIYDTIIEGYEDVQKLKNVDDMITYGASDEKILKSLLNIIFPSILSEKIALTLSCRAIS